MYTKVTILSSTAKNAPPPQDIFTSFFRFSKTILPLPPHHLVDDAGVALDDFHDFGGDVFFDVVRHGDAVVAVGVHL